MPTMTQLGQLEEARTNLKEIPRQAFSAFESLAEGHYLAVMNEMVECMTKAQRIVTLCNEIMKGGE